MRPLLARFICCWFSRGNRKPVLYYFANHSRLSISHFPLRHHYWWTIHLSVENNWSQFPLFQNNLDEEDHIYNIFQYIEILKVAVRPALWNRRRGKILLGDRVFFSYIKNKKGRAVMRTGFLEKWPIVKLKLREVLQATPWHWDLWIFQGFWSGDQDVLLTFQNICRARRPI